MAYSVVPTPLGWSVKNAARERISPVFHSREAAIDWAARRIERTVPQERHCLACQRPFRSAGIQNRLCPHCCSQRPDDGLGDAQRPIIKSRRT
ncbi:DUF2188 domain-containing protein [Cereibacter sphaeroides]|uniref:DUF2188 domain-containing protein n=1 Tax=Cereibacter sphaeroides TaxID=1063 RepID=UPI000F52356E|nr:DUF2188 domain-containing protein [Cereibacter sphaeroides]AZB57235.1 DUF2188 domain-containing protein [Cereibacter sphaeroides]AZB61519.1 DUF2188 domain-containing protein [Cereibacter sphaeroides]